MQRVEKREVAGQSPDTGVVRAEGDPGGEESGEGADERGPGVPDRLRGVCGDVAEEVPVGFEGWELRGASVGFEEQVGGLVVEGVHMREVESKHACSIPRTEKVSSQERALKAV